MNSVPMSIINIFHMTLFTNTFISSILGNHVQLKNNATPTIATQRQEHA